MSEAKHTPGPWPYKPTGDRKRIIVGDGLVDGPNGYEVAEVYSDDCDFSEALANARLIAAAPDLLAALLAVADLYGWNQSEPIAATARQALAAIRKATEPTHD